MQAVILEHNTVSIDLQHCSLQLQSLQGIAAECDELNSRVAQLSAEIADLTGKNNSLASKLAHQWETQSALYTKNQ